MAYTFNQIDDMLNQNNNQNNIFSGGDQSGQGGQQQQGGTQAQGGNKTTTEGELGAQGSSSSTTAPTTNPAATKQNSGQAILAKNKNTNAGFSQDVGNKIKQSQADLENEANKYVANQQSKGNYNVNTGAALAGDQAARSGLEEVLHGPARQADDFRSNISSQFQDVDELASQSGLQNYLKKRGNESYSQGAAALDSLLLSRNPEYKKNVQEAKVQRDILRNRQNELEGAEFKSAQQQKIDEARDAARRAAIEDLTGRQSALMNSLQEKAAQENAARAALRAQVNTPEQEKAKFNEVKAELAKTNPELAALLNYTDPGTKIKLGMGPGGGGVELDAAPGYKDYKLSDYYGFGRDVSAEEMADQGQASQYNLIQDLLGAGGNRLSQSALSDRGSFNKEALQSDLFKRGSEDKAVADQAKAKAEQDAKNAALVKKLTAKGADRSKTARIAKNLGVGDGVPIGLTDADLDQISGITGASIKTVEDLGKYMTKNYGVTWDEFQKFMEGKGALGGTIGKAMDEAEKQGGRIESAGRSLGGNAAKAIKTGRI